jgi:hypothetical protein
MWMVVTNTSAKLVTADMIVWGDWNEGSKAIWKRILEACLANRRKQTIEYIVIIIVKIDLFLELHI